VDSSDLTCPEPVVSFLTHAVTASYFELSFEVSFNDVSLFFTEHDRSLQVKDVVLGYKDTLEQHGQDANGTAPAT
jgi:hypothetical protein